MKNVQCTLDFERRNSRILGAARLPNTLFPSASAIRTMLRIIGKDLVTPRPERVEVALDRLGHAIRLVVNEQATQSAIVRATLDVLHASEIEVLR